MLKYQNLRFFSGTSGELDFNYNSAEETWSGVIYMPKVSTGLYETSNLYIFEEVVVESGVLEYVRPISENLNSNTLSFRFQSDIGMSKDIIMYNAIVEGGEYVISEYSSKTEDILDFSIKLAEITYSNPNHTSNVTVSPVTFKKVSDKTDKSPVTCNIALMSQVEALHQRVLEILDGDKLVASITIYGETESEDERLAVLLQNMGLSIAEEETIIFKDSDINEISTDWLLINNKRKELLLEAHNIAPFIGTYKALLNAIKFYGYDNLTIKEYWLNINEQSSNFGKLLAVPVPGQDTEGFLIDKAKQIQLPNSNHKKTSRFSLVYRINEPTGSVDEWDLPIVKETSDFTPEEVLIKLYGLKKKLQSKYLPLQAKIVDITAEGDFFSQFTQNVWNNQNTIQVQNSGVEVDFEVFPKRKLFIEDLRLVSEDLNSLNLSFPLSSVINENVITDIKSFYQHYYDQELNTFPTLSPVPIGCPLVLMATSLTDYFDNADYSWNDADLAANDYVNGSQASVYTWDKIWSRDVYEIEWILTGPNGYSFTSRGKVQDLYEMALVLPYAGTYDVILNMYDLYNTRSFLIKKSEIIVHCKNVDIYGVYEWKNHKNSWNDQKYTWKYAGGLFNFSQDSPVDIEDMVASWYLTLDRNNYIYDDANGIEFSTVRRYLNPSSPTSFSETTGPYVWKRLKNQVWNDGLNVTWDAMRIGSDITASFKMDVRQSEGFANGDQLSIIWNNPGTNQNITESYEIQAVYPINSSDISAWQSVANELNSLSPQTNPIFSKFNWNPVLIDTDNDGIVDSCEYIVAVGKEYSSSYDFKQVQFSSQTGGLISGEINYTAYNPTWNDVIVYEDYAKITLMTHMTFAFEKTNMPGIVSYKWSINNLSNPNFEEVISYNQWLTYLFSEHGNYEIKLKLIDSNGNQNEVKRNMISVVKHDELLLSL